MTVHLWVAIVSVIASWIGGFCMGIFYMMVRIEKRTYKNETNVNDEPTDDE